MLTWTIAGTVGALVLAYLIFVGVRALRDIAEKRQVRSAFAQYLSPALIEELAENPDQLTLDGEVRQMSVMLCGILNYKEISSKFGSDLHEQGAFLNRFHSMMVDPILKWKGTVDKFMGHRIMSFWGAPIEDKAHVFNVCGSALAMSEALKELNSELAAEAQENDEIESKITICFSIESGDCLVGNLGSEQRFDYSVIGDPVDRASELQKLAVRYGVEILVGQCAQRQVSDYAMIEVDEIPVEGTETFTSIFALLGDAKLGGTEQFQNLKRCHDEFLSAYRADRRADARTRLEDCRAAAVHFELSGLYDFYETRLDEVSA